MQGPKRLLVTQTEEDNELFRWEVNQTWSFTLPFVDREKETRVIASLLLHNFVNVAKGAKPCLVTCNQMFGSGKTAMGRHLCEAFARELDADPEFKAEVIQSYGEPVKMLCQARYVLLDFTDFVLTEGLEKSLYFRSILTFFCLLGRGKNKYGWYDVYVSLLLWDKFKMPPVPLNSNITFKNQKLPLMHVLNALNVYLHHSKGSKQLVTFSFADYVVQYFEEHTTQYGMDYRLPLIKPLLSNLCLDNGAPLEFLIRAIVV